VRSANFHELGRALLATRAEIRNAHIAGLTSPALGQFLAQRAYAKRKAICDLLRPEIRLRAAAMQEERRYYVLERWNPLQRRGVRGK